MNPKKRKLQLASAISSIIGGSIILILAVAQTITFLEPEKGDMSFYFIDLIIVNMAIPIIFSLAMIILGAIFIKKNLKSIPITLIVLNTLLIVPAVPGFLNGYWTWFLQDLAIASSSIYLIIIVGLLVFNILYLCTKTITPIKKAKIEEESLNPTRRNVRISAAILSIVAGCIQLIYTIISIVIVNDAVNALNYFGLTGGIDGVFIALAVINILISLSLIILGAFFAKKNSTGIAFTLMALTIVLIILDIISIANAATVLNIILLIVYLALLALIITYICLKEAPFASKANKNLTKTTPEPESSKLSIDKKLEVLKQLRYEKNITEEEYQKLLMKYLENL